MTLSLSFHALGAISLALLCGCATAENEARDADAILRAYDTNDVESMRSLLGRCPDLQKSWIRLDPAQARKHGKVEMAELFEQYPGSTACEERKAAQEQASRKAVEDARAERAAELRRIEQSADLAENQRDHQQAFDLYTAGLQKLGGRISTRRALRTEELASYRESVDRMRAKYLRLVATMASLPEVPEEARRHLVRGKAFIRQSASSDGYESGAREIEQAVGIAPWWVTAYYDLGLAQEGAKRYEDAIRNFNFYVLGAPKAPDVRAVKDKIYELEAMKEKE